MLQRLMQRRERTEFNEEEFFRFAKSYLSEAFPNPQRIDCPPDSELTGLAEHPKGRSVCQPAPDMLFPVLQPLHGNFGSPEASECGIGRLRFVPLFACAPAPHRIRSLWRDELSQILVILKHHTARKA